MSSTALNRVDASETDGIFRGKGQPSGKMTRVLKTGNRKGLLSPISCVFTDCNGAVSRITTQRVSARQRRTTTARHDIPRRTTRVFKKRGTPHGPPLNQRETPTLGYANEVIVDLPGPYLAGCFMSTSSTDKPVAEMISPKAPILRHSPSTNTSLQPSLPSVG